MITWITSHWDLVAALLFVLLSISEALALNPKIKANSIFQLVFGGLKKLYELAKGKSEQKPQ